MKIKVLALACVLAGWAIPSLAQPVRAETTDTQTTRSATLEMNYDLDGEAVSAAKIVALANLADSTTHTIAAQPDVCRLIDATITDANTSITAGTLTFTGLDCLGFARVCTFDFAVVGTRGSGVKTLPVTTGPIGSSCYLSSVTSVISSALTGEDAGTDKITVGYTTVVGYGVAEYGVLKAVGPNGEHGVDPFGSTYVSTTASTTGSSLTFAGTGAFTDVLVNDLLLIPVVQGNGSTVLEERKVATRSSADSVVLNRSITVASTSFYYKRSYFSPDPTDDMSISVAGWKSVMFPWAIAANANTGGVITNFECTTNRNPVWTLTPWVQIATTTTASAGTQAWTLGTSTAPYVVDLTLASFQACRFSMKFGTNDDGDGAPEDISLSVALRK